MFSLLRRWVYVLIGRGCGTQPQCGIEPETMDHEPLAAESPSPPNMLPSPNCYALVRDFEGLSLSAYYCPAGVLTIGYGHTGGVYEGQRITAQEATNLLIRDMDKVARDIMKMVSAPVTQGQFDALCSFAFNVGAWDNGLSTSTLLRKVNQGNIQGAAKEFPRWVYATVNGRKQVLKGLERRREAERKLFLTGHYS